MMEEHSTPLKSNVQKPKILLFAFTLVVVAIASSLATYFYVKNYQLKKTTMTVNETPTPTISMNKKPTPTFYPTSNNPNLKRYISDKLGITFTYLEELVESSSGPEVTIFEQGNKVFINPFDPSSKPDDGQWIEMFTKNPNESLEEAIRRIFLANYSPNDCFVKESNKPNFKGAIITFPIVESEDMPWWQNAEKCPQIYTTTNGISYFIEDPNFPTKFYYLSIGQYPIMSENNKLWQDTLQIIK